MKRLCNSIVFTILFTFLPIGARASQLLIPGGQVIGLQLQNDTVTVAAFDDTLGSCAKDAGLCVGDEILSVNGRTVHSAGDIRSALEENGQTASITIRRESKTRQLQLTPRNTADGPRLGVYLKQGIAGIGTITWYDPQTGVFGTLGHGVNDGRGNLAKLRSGSAFPADVLSVKKGTSGSPGQLKGNADANTHWGTLLRNTPQGVFGTARQGIEGEPLPVADYGEISSGAATIRSTVAGSTVQEYSVEILKIYPEDRPDGRNFLLKVTDVDLLAATGGIVQGMGVIDNRDNTKKPENKGFSAVTLKLTPTSVSDQHRHIRIDAPLP